MTTRPKSQCLACAHWISPLDTGVDKQTCAAFPDEIPDDIWWNRVDHRQPYEGDHGIRWEAAEDVRKGGKMTFPEYALNL